MIKTFNSLFVTMFNLGKIKFIPGTIGSLVTIIILYYLFHIINISKNIILIGDQNQLGQPIKGTHPNNSGQSILDYLLEGKDTIPEDRGIFLNKTYRLNSRLNKFISSNFYEERLICDERTDKRIIKFNKTNNKIL